VENKPIVSVVMCVYNENQYMIEEAIQSVQEQTYKNWELIIVLDNPTDIELSAYLLGKKSDNIRVHINDQNIGAAMSRNIGTQNANGKYIAILDGDDVCVPERLEKELCYLEAGNYDMVCTGRHLIDENGNKIDAPVEDITEQYLIKCLPYINYVTNSTVLIKKKVYESLGGYYNYPCAHDYDFWLRLKKAQYKIGYLKEDLVGYRVRANSITGNSSYLQTIVCAYVRKLYEKNKILAQYDGVQFEKFVERFHVDNPKVIKNFRRSMQKRRNFTTELKRKKYYVAMWNYACAVFGSKIYRQNIYNSVKLKWMKMVNFLE